MNGHANQEQEANVKARCKALEETWIANRQVRACTKEDLAAMVEVLVAGLNGDVIKLEAKRTVHKNDLLKKVMEAGGHKEHVELIHGSDVLPPDFILSDLGLLEKVELTAIKTNANGVNDTACRRCGDTQHDSFELHRWVKMNGDGGGTELIWCKKCGFSYEKSWSDE